MKIILVNAPLSDIHAQRAGGLLQQAITELNHECIVLPGKELPNKLQFLERRKQEKELRALHPGLIIYCSEKNFLPVKGLRSIIHPILWVDENLPNPQLIRNELTSGNEYFFYTGDIDKNAQWERVLQAFSQFKKWQQSALQLVISGHIDPKFKNIFQQKLEAYKYKQEIIIQQNPQLAAAAFCLLTNANFYDEKLDTLTGFRSGIPVISNEPGKNFCGDSALYANFKDPKSLSQQMINIYKNEAMYNHLSEKGKLTSNAFSKHQALQQLSERIQQAMNTDFN